MSLSRRAFVQTLGMGAAGALGSSFIGARGREAWIWSGLEGEAWAAEAANKIILASNENPMGPGEVVLKAVRAAIGPEGRGPGRYPGNEDDLIDAIAKKFSVKRENVLLGAGSSQVLRTATHVFTSKEKPLVGSMPTYEECSGYAALIGSPIRGVPLDTHLSMDLDATLSACKSAGMLFYCNPNNPTATLVPAATTLDFLNRLLKSTTDTHVLVDEAYFDYVTAPDHQTLIPLALDNPRVIVARTFSKAYGMAGLRVGYGIAHADTIKKMAEWDSGGGPGGGISILSIAAAIAAIQQDPSRIAKERERNKAARDFTREFFRKAGYKDTESQTNFLFVDVRRPIQDFQAACKQNGVLVARPFPPLLTYARISIGTLEEMKKATEVFKKVLAEPVAVAA
jgi:histidinol-phosphate aminotransferase